MNLFELVTTLKDLTAAVKAGDLAKSLDLLGDLAKLAATLIGGFAGPAAAADYAAVEAALADLEGEAGLAAGGPDGREAVDPAIVMLIVQVAKTIFELIRKRRAGG